ncbi:gustatory receptor for sugar taste 64b-like [Anopheles maculipalpis]|uniref:gustatory receptor for sugar taste 64b-like n=1 Tax=Anopheles maculipalpis TaxID=1496333 RepID=UPI00215988B9|nr:gustatory receptor for sugar taste 64b-like [Anopheles maculipalpis]
MNIDIHQKHRSKNWRGNWKSFSRQYSHASVGTFHHAVAPVLLLGQCFTLLPVVNIFSANFRTARFKLRSFRCIYSLLYLALTGVYCVLSIRWYIRKGLNISYFANCIYMVVVYLSAWLFFFIAIQWHSILDAFASCERSFLRDHYRLQTRGTFNLVWKIRFAGFAIFALALVEDWLNYYSAYQSNIVQITTCNRTNVTVWHNFYLREHPHVFHILPFNGFTIAVTEWINRCMRYTWTYLDIFIISFCYGAQFRYEQIFRRLVAVQGIACPINFWHELRMDYVAVSELVHELDSRFGHLILLACANDMYFIATQLFNGFQRRRAIANYVYFWYSLLLLMFRTIIMLYVGSGVYVASTSPLHLLRNVPSKHWGIDLQRLTDEVASGENVLSGKQFFFLKRQLILAMAGTLVTYELVLLDQVKKIPDSSTDCSYF